MGLRSAPGEPWRPSIPLLDEKAFAQGVSRRLGGRRFPYAGQWELTCRCNLACVMCYTDPFNTPDRIKRELQYEEIVRILDELCEAGCLELTFTGGEPLARSDFLDVYTAAKRKGFRLTIFTNGTLITGRVADQLAAYPPKMIEVSFHGLTAQQFDAITQVQGSFEQCLRGIRLLRERDLPLTLKTLGMTLNRDEVLKIKALAESFGGVQYKFGTEMRPRLDGGEDPFDLQLTEGEIRAVEEADPQMCAERRHQQELEHKSVPRCGGGHLSFHIDAYGQLQLCSNNRRQSYDLRRGSFQEGFEGFLPQFPCPLRQSAADAPGSPAWEENR